MRYKVNLTELLKRKVLLRFKVLMISNKKTASLSAYRLEFGGGGEDRTPDLGVMNPTL